MASTGKNSRSLFNREVTDDPGASQIKYFISPLCGEIDRPIAAKLDEFNQKAISGRSIDWRHLCHSWPARLSRMERKRGTASSADIYSWWGAACDRTFISAEGRQRTVGASRRDYFDQLSIILLYGLLEIWFFDLGKLLKLEVEFNTVGYPILGPMFRGMVCKTWKINRDMSELPEDKTFDDMEAISFSFYNGLRIEALQDDEKLLGHVFQREIKVPWLRIFHRSIAPQTAIAVTDKQLILLQQDLRFTKHHEEWIFTFCPLYRVVDIKEVAFNQWQKISIQLLPFGQPEIEVILEPKNVKEWRQIWGQLNIRKDKAAPRD